MDKKEEGTSLCAAHHLATPTAVTTDKDSPDRADRAAGSAGSGASRSAVSEDEKPAVVASG